MKVKVALHPSPPSVPSQIPRPQSSFRLLPFFVDSEGGWGGGIVIVLDDIGEDEIPAPDHLAHVVAPPSSVGAVVSAAWELLNERRQRLRLVCRNPRSRGVALLSAAGA